LSVTHYNNELGEVVEYEMLDPQCLAEMTPLGVMSVFYLISFYFSCLLAYIYVYRLSVVISCEL